MTDFHVVYDNKGSWRVEDSSSSAWTFTSDNSLVLCTQRYWLFYNKTVERWLETNTMHVGITGGYQFWTFPNEETKTEFLLKWT